MDETTNVQIYVSLMTRKNYEALLEILMEELSRQHNVTLISDSRIDVIKPLQFSFIQETVNG